MPRAVLLPPGAAALEVAQVPPPRKLRVVGAPHHDAPDGREELELLIQVHALPLLALTRVRDAAAHAQRVAACGRGRRAVALTHRLHGQQQQRQRRQRRRQDAGSKCWCICHSPSAPRIISMSSRESSSVVAWASGWAGRTCGAGGARLGRKPGRQSAGLCTGHCCSLAHAHHAQHWWRIRHVVATAPRWLHSCTVMSNQFQLSAPGRAEGCP